MANRSLEPIPIISPRLYAQIALSPRLRQRLFPDGLLSSPYTILDYQATLTLHDVHGRNATFQRTQQVRFLQENVSAILDHIWGDGVVLAGYHNSAGSLAGSIKDEGRRHLLILLKRPMAKGEELTFQVRRTARVGFLRPEQRMETIIDHPIARLQRSVIFPKHRPCRRAWLTYEDFETPLPIISLPDGRTLVRFEVLGPSAHLPYTVHWSW